MLIPHIKKDSINIYNIATPTSYVTAVEKHQKTKTIIVSNTQIDRGTQATYVRMSSEPKQPIYPYLPHLCQTR